MKITMFYQAQVQAKVHLEDPAPPLFEISTVLSPNRDNHRNSLTCVMSKNLIEAVRATAAAEMNKLYDLPSRVNKREYKL
jgi:hypothetical protein